MPANRSKPVYAKYIEHIPPDVTACIFWLKNRDPQHWRDSQQLEHVLGKYIISDKRMSEEEWARERADVLDAGIPTAAVGVSADDEPRFGDGRRENHKAYADKVLALSPHRNELLRPQLTAPTHPIQHVVPYFGLNRWPKQSLVMFANVIALSSCCCRWRWRSEQ